MRGRTWLGLGCAALVLAGQAAFAPAAEALVQINGSGSTYVGLAMSDWQNGANSRGIPVNYSALGSPAGVNQYGDRTVDFAGTEAEVSSLQAAGGGGLSANTRGYQYVPDVAGAVAVMYNVTDAAGRRVDSLHLTRAVIARIFTRDITRWNDPAITATNGGFALPNQPITLIGRSGQSGTTALFYDFVAHVAPGPYNAFVSRNADKGVGPLPPGVRPIQLPTLGPDADFYRLFADSDQIAQTVSNGSIPFSIGYDEFGYAKKYNAPTAWVENQAGQYTLPFAANIAAALTKANLRPDLSQELSGVYTNTDPLTYPISAYSYLMTPCGSGRSTCKGGYPDPSKTDTMAAFIEHIACDGQINMARVGYSPLPPNLSQEMMNANARLTGKPAKQLNAGNCDNPTFHASLGAGSTAPKDPFEDLGGVDALTHGGTGGGPTSGPSSGPNAPTTGPSSAGAGPSADSPDATDANGGSTDWRNAEPASYQGSGFGGFGAWAALVLFAAICLPLLIRGLVRRRRS
ncbi:substrate-binding domain-containing protein [Amycolatopsis rhabdoformis]|uniref:Substrate-binding domain-containing protein n=1 Tax=Amycolatopsis rhabdoformis TaxID=1448059 RepID=A0ABZ1IFY8_9PSEU|nr:substrate-binding domain-containing protein [Amycolatopsis rhabdoformis]WSE32618.1 substrate-binding domain-containing protein [Amycolatopsis rhabdoformis]